MPHVFDSVAILSSRPPLCPLKIYYMLVLPYYVGLWRGDLARLDFANINLQGGTIMVRQAKPMNPATI